MTQILVTGASGLVGSHILRVLADGNDVIGTYQNHPEHLSNTSAPGMPLQLENGSSIEEVLHEANPDVVVHCAAVSSLSECESNPELAQKINVRASIDLATRCHDGGRRFVFFSTDQVFDGTGGDYAENESPAPLHIYGKTKRLAEEGVLAVCPEAVVIRISLVYGASPSGSRSASEILVDAVTRGEKVRLFTDEIRTPVLVDDVALVVRDLLESSFSGLLHVAGPESVSRHAFGHCIVDHLGLDASLLESVRMDEVDLPTARPKNLSLNTERLRQFTACPPRTLKEGLAAQYSESRGAD